MEQFQGSPANPCAAPGAAAAVTVSGTGRRTELMDLGLSALIPARERGSDLDILIPHDELGNEAANRERRDAPGATAIPDSIQAPLQILYHGFFFSIAKIVY